jgi:translation initiation factor eIF-2B subunit epsilon
VIGSVVGSDCVIGRNTVIRNSYIWDGANVGAGCVVEESIIGENVKLLDGTKVRRGCLVSEGAVLGPSVDVGEFRRISKTKPVDEDEDDEDDEDEEEDGEQADGSAPQFCHKLRLLTSRYSIYRWSGGRSVFMAGGR